MALKDTLLSTANKLIEQYGNDYTLSKTVTTGKIYNPDTDEFEGTDESIYLNVKAVQSKREKGDDELTEIQSVKEILLIEYKDDIANIDNTWKVNGRKIYYVKQTSLQNQDILYRLYVG
jgi:hypothetical protein